MNNATCTKRGTTLLQISLASPWHFRRNGRYYLRIRPRGQTRQYFTVSLRTSERSTAMELTKDILSALAVFHLNNPAATWDDLKPQLLTIADECLTVAHGDDSLVAYAMVYDELKSSLTLASAYSPLTAVQQRAVAVGGRILTAAQERLQGRPEGLVGIVKELSDEGQPSQNAPKSVSPHQEPTQPQQAPLLWSELAAQYLEEHKADLKDSSLTQLLSNHKQIEEAFDACDVRDLRKHTRADLIALRTELAETRAPSTVNTILAKLIAVMGWAVNNDHLPKSYTAKLKFTKGTESQREAFKRDQVETIMTRVNALPVTSWERWGLSLLIITGARVGEVMQLTKEDIKEVSGGHWCISINEESADKSLKNKHSKRLVPLTNGAFGFDLKAFVQAVEDGYLPSANTITAARKAGILRTFVKEVLGENKTEFQTLHSLRHHMASSMEAKGVPVVYAQAILGHASGTMTYDTYGSGVPIGVLAGVLKGLFDSDQVAT